MALFWIAAGGMALAAAGFVLLPLAFPRASPFHAQPREANLAALRAAWAELERDRVAGLLPDDQYRSARDDLARRAAVELEEGPAPAAARPSWIAAISMASVVTVTAFCLYGLVGNPEAIGESEAFRGFPNPLTAEQAPAFRDRLVKHLADDPGDARAWALLGRLELALERFPQAEAAFGKAVTGRKVALDPDVWCDYADAAGLARGGTLEGKPMELVAKALALDPSHPRALDLAASAAYERGDYAQAAGRWRQLLAQLDEGSPRHRELSAAIARAQR